MSRWMQWSSLYLIGSLLLYGCGKQAPQQTAVGQADAAATPAHDHAPIHDHDHSDHQTHDLQAATTPEIPADTPPENIVQRFLEALRSGDDEVAAHLLTTVAREETAKHDLVVQPPGTPAAHYEVGRVELTDDNRGAYVSSIWSEPDQTGLAQGYEIVWVLRHQSDGWRIAGMATEVVPGQMPLFLNFEDPQDMLRKREQAQQALAEFSEGAASQVEQAELPAGQTTR